MGNKLKVIYLGDGINRYEYVSVSAVREEAKVHGITIGDDVLIGDEVTIGADVNIGDDTIIGNCVKIGSNCIIGGDVTIGRRVIIDYNCVVVSDSVICHCTRIGHDTYIGDKTYIGHHSKIGHDVTITAGVSIGITGNIRDGAVICFSCGVSQLYIYDARGYLNTENNIYYIQLGCFTRSVSEWEDDFYNNDAEFPIDEEETKDRYKAYKYILNTLTLHKERYVPSLPIDTKAVSI